MGKKAISLEVLAHKAEDAAKVDPEAGFEALHYRHQQEGLLEDKLDSVPSLQRIAACYEACWLLPEALRVWDRIQRIRVTASPAMTEHDRWLRAAANAVTDGTALLTPAGDFPFKTFLQANEAIGCRVSGRFAIGSMQEIPTTGSRIDEAGLANTFSEVWAESGYDGPPHTTVEQISWVGTESVDYRRIFCIAAPFDPDGPKVSAAMPLLRGATYLPVVIVLSSRGPDEDLYQGVTKGFPSIACTETNESLRRAYVWLTQEGGANCWFKSVWRSLDRTLARISTTQMEVAGCAEGKKE
jgi:hypothetical protein